MEKYTEEELSKLKPCCRVCNAPLNQIEYKGYYDNFLFWDFTCTCNDKIPFKIDETEIGAYA